MGRKPSKHLNLPPGLRAAMNLQARYRITLHKQRKLAAQLREMQALHLGIVVLLQDRGARFRANRQPREI